jgi:hypothetical protein
LSFEEKEDLSWDIINYYFIQPRGHKDVDSRTGFAASVSIELTAPVMWGMTLVERYA